jgi:hypothetical protein
MFWQLFSLFRMCNYAAVGGVPGATRKPPYVSTGSAVQLSDSDNRRLRMTEPKTFSYTTHLDLKFDPLALVDVDQLAKSVTDQWYNQTLCKVNDSVCGSA